MEKVRESHGEASLRQRGRFGAQQPARATGLKSKPDRKQNGFSPMLAVVFWGGLLLTLFLIPGTRSLGAVVILVALSILIRLKLLDHARRTTLLGHPAVPWLSYGILTIPGPYVIGVVGEGGFLTIVWWWNAFLWFIGLMAYFGAPAGWYKAGPGYWRAQDFWGHYWAARSVRRKQNASNGAND